MLPFKITLNLLLDSIWPYKKFIALVVILTLSQTWLALFGLSTFIPLLSTMMGNSFDLSINIPIFGDIISYILNYKTDPFFMLLGIIAGAIILRRSITFLVGIIQTYLKNKVDSDWQNHVLGKWLKAPHEYHGTQDSSQVMHLTAHEIAQLGNSVSTIVPMINGTVQAALALAFLSLVSWQAMLGLLFSGLIIGMPIIFLIRRMIPTAWEDTSKIRDYTTNVHDVIKRIDLIEVFGTADREKEKLKKFFHKYIGARLRLQIYRLSSPLIVQFLGTFLVLLILSYFYIFGSDQSILSTTILFIGGLIILQQAMEQISNSLGAMTKIHSAVIALKPILDLPIETTPIDGLYAEKLPKEGKLQVDNLAFQYNGSGWIIKDTTFNLNHGELTMLYGATGAGKTTFLRLLQRLIIPKNGNIIIGGIPLSEFKTEDLHQVVLTLNQDRPTFSGTIRQNVCYGLENISEERVWVALKQAAADAFVKKLSDGLDSNIGIDGAFLSGGQRQRIALARIFLVQPMIMLLDEPTSALDRETETHIIQSIVNMAKAGQTILMSTHKIELASLANNLLWFEDTSITAGSFGVFQKKLGALTPKLLSDHD